MITREINNHSYYKKRLEGVGFPDVTPTLLEKDALDFQMGDLKPTYAIIDARFYQCCTPFLVGELKQKFPETKFAAVSIGEYPPELAMYFILNGAGSYITTTDGFDKVLDCLAEIPKGREFISPAVEKQKELRLVTPKPAGKISDRHREVIRLICCGFKDLEIADTLHISRRTVDNHKTEIFTSMNVRNAVELIISALTLKIVLLDELYFYPKDYMVNPLPDAKIKGRARE